MRTLAALLAVFALAVLGVQLSFSAATEAPADFTFLNGTEPRTLDPGVMTGAPEGRIADALFEGLTRREARTLRPVPGVAESWEISPDGRTYVFHLRADARWSDGTPVTAHDFAWAWRRLEDPARGAEYAYILHMVKGAEIFNTWGAQADALAGPVPEALAALAPGDLDARTWQAFVVEQRLADRTAGTPDAWLAAQLERGRGLGAGERERFVAALGDEARRRRAAFDQAAARFGRDLGVQARGPRTLMVELVAPTPYFLELTAFYPAYPVSRAAVEAHPQDWFLPGHIVSNGPFELERWRVNHKLRLVRSDSYWDRDAIRLASIDALPIENGTTMLNLYLTGGADWLPGGYPSDLVDALKTRPDFYSGPGMVVYYYRFNCERPPFDDVRVREAISIAIDRREIVEDVLGLGQIPAYHLVPPGMTGYTPPESRAVRDVARARRLLAEAGYPGGKGFPAVGILFNTSESHKKIAEVIADQLRRTLGIAVNAYNQEWQGYQASVRAGDYDMARAGWIGDYLDPNTFLDMWVTGGGNNQTGWGDALYDGLIRAAADVESWSARPEPLLARLREPGEARVRLAALRGASDAATRLEAAARLRMQLLQEAEAILVQDAFPVMPIYFYVVSGLVSPQVRGFYARLQAEDGTWVANLQDLHPLRDLWIEREPER